MQGIFPWPTCKNQQNCIFFHFSVDATDITYLKYGLTKWTKQFSRTIDLDRFLIHLKKNRVLSETEKLEIQKEYNMEEQCGKLIMKMMDETQENLWMFCKCLRSFDENLANLIDNKNDDGKQIGNRC